jgi:hypothetical protein
MSVACTIYGLGLQANCFIPGLPTSSSTSQVDLRVKLGLTPAWLNGAMDAACCWYTTPHRDEHGEPILQVWELADGEYFRLRYADSTEFLVDRLGTQLWATWPETLTL